MKIARMSMVNRLVVLAGILLTVDPQATFASDKVVGKHATATILADKTAIVPGGTVRVGIRFEIDDEWHIYWIAAGEPDAPANPTHIELTAPSGFKVSGPYFPPPNRVASDVTGEKLYELE